MKYILHMSEECGGTETASIHAKDHRTAVKLAEETLTEWVKEGDYGINGAVVRASWVLVSEEGEELDHDELMVDLDPDHDALIREADGDADCAHEWKSTYTVEGGCRENPGVWSTGGTRMVYKSHCIHCGLQRTDRRPGSQRNPGECDTVVYHQPKTKAKR